MPGTKLFNYFEAKEKVGMKVRVVNDFRDVARGTNGRVVRVEQIFDAYCVAITWNGFRGQITTDFLTKYEYDNFLEELKV